MTSTISVRRVAGPADHKIFLRFPWTVYKDDPHWVPPLVSMRRDMLDPRKNPTLSYLDIDYFIAWRGTTPVGTIAAFINHHHNEFHKEHIGWFGLFEVLDDREAALALLSTAEEWVRAKGYDAIRGPASFNDLGEFGLQVDGFGPPHVLLMPYNPPYYMTYVEAAGYKGIMDLASYRILAADMMGENVPPKLRRVVGKLRERSKVTMRLPDMKHLDHEIELLEQLYIGAWSDNWGFVPPKHEEMVYLIKQLRPFFDPRMGLIAEIDGRPVGFVLLFPDLNQAIGPARPHPDTPEMITLLRLLWYWKIRRKVNRVRVPFLGVLEEYRGRGIDAMLYMDIIDPAVKMGFHEADFGWILANNQAMVQVAELVRGQIYKTYRIYEKPLHVAAE
jgi:GNAT superfamily N-acetyltransferase